MLDQDLDPAATLTALEHGARLLVRPPKPVRQALAEARAAHERSHLVIAGPEGAGKSTMINALLGMEVSPISHAYPGTVAPVYFRYGEGALPVYRVVLRDGDGPPVTREMDRAEFDRHLLQEHNAGNERGVLRGDVALVHPLLRDGLRLVDLPGVSGVSEQVAAETRAYLSGTAFTLVLLIFGRTSMAVLADLLQELREAHGQVRLAAVVCNEPNPVLLAPGKIDDYLESRGRFLRETLASRAPESAEARVFALHLLSLAPDSTPDPGPDQADRWRAFQDAVAEHARTDGRAAADAACLRLARELRGPLAERAALLADLRNGRLDPATARRLRSQALAEAVAAGSVAATTAEEATREEDWRTVAEVARTQADRLLSVLDRHEAQVNSVVALPTAEANKIAEEVGQALQYAHTAIKKALGKSETRLGEGLADAYLQALTAYGAILPVVHAMSTDATSPKESDATIGRYTFESLSKIINDEENLFVLLTAAVVVPIIHYAFGGNRGRTLSQIRELRKSVRSTLLDGPAAGVEPPNELHARWLKARRDSLAAFEKELQNTVDKYGAAALARTPATLAALRQQQDAIEAGRREVAACTARLTADQ